MAKPQHYRTYRLTKTLDEIEGRTTQWQNPGLKSTKPRFNKLHANGRTYINRELTAAEMEKTPIINLETDLIDISNNVAKAEEVAKRMAEPPKPLRSARLYKTVDDVIGKKHPMTSNIGEREVRSGNGGILLLKNKAVLKTRKPAILEEMPESKFRAEDVKKAQKNELKTKEKQKTSVKQELKQKNIEKQKVDVKPKTKSVTRLLVMQKSKASSQQQLTVNPKLIEKQKEKERAAILSRIDIADAVKSAQGANLILSRLEKQIQPVKMSQGQTQPVRPKQIVKPPQKVEPAKIPKTKPTSIDKIKPSQIVTPIQIPTQTPVQIQKPAPVQITHVPVIPAIAQIVDVVTDVIQISHYQVGENQIKYLYMRRKQQQDALLKRKKPKSQKPVETDKRGNTKLKRTIFNKLGSLESMFGESAPKETVKKSTKRTRKA